MSRRALASIALASAAVGCSLLIPLDYTGGTAPTHPGGGGQGGSGAPATGGTAGFGGTTGDAGSSEGGQHGGEAEGGAGNPGEAGGVEPGTGGDAGAETGGTAGSSVVGDGGTAGSGGTGNAGGGALGGTDATGGMDAGGFGGVSVGGMGGQTGGRGGRGGKGQGGMQGGMSGSGVAGHANCPGADLSTDPNNCGSCDNVCDSTQECADGVCISSACDGICATWLMPDNNGDGPRKDPLNTTADVCVQVDDYEPSAGYLPAFNCWNVNAPRTIQVNGVTMICDNASHLMSVAKRKGGYCVHATAGDYAWAGWVMPYAAGNCCVAPAGASSSR